MKGSFEAPPIVIRQSRFELCTNLVIYALVSLILAAVVIYPLDPFFPRGQETGRLILYVFLYAGLFAFTCLTALATLSLAMPAMLRIEPDGLLYRTVWNSRHFAWEDVDRFDVHDAERGIVFFNLSQRYLWEHPHIKSPLRWLAVKWERDAVALANLLNDAKRKWSDDRTPRIVNAIPEHFSPPPVYRVW